MTCSRKTKWRVYTHANIIAHYPNTQVSYTCSIDMSSINYDNCPSLEWNVPQGQKEQFPKLRILAPLKYYVYIPFLIHIVWSDQLLSSKNEINHIIRHNIYNINKNYALIKQVVDLPLCHLSSCPIRCSFSTPQQLLGSPLLLI